MSEELFDYESEPFDYMKHGGEREKIISAYTNNLKYILDEIYLLLENMDRNTVIITADHGEAFGEYGTFKHPSGSLNPVVRRVPWVETSAKNMNTLTLESNESTKSVSVEQRLQALGYK